MTMDATVESGRHNEPSNTSSTSPVSSQPASNKRSFDVAFLTGISESVKREDDGLDPDNKLQQPGSGSRSAFKKVSKSASGSGAETGGNSAGQHPLLPLSTDVMGGLLPPAAAAAAAYQPFFPAIATTLSLQLLQQQQQQNNAAAKGLAMSLFSHPAAAAAAVMAAHQQSFFQQQQPNKAGINNIPRVNNFIEDYLRAQATLYQQHESLLASSKNAHHPQHTSFPSEGAQHQRLSSTSSRPSPTSGGGGSMAPPPTPPPIAPPVPSVTPAASTSPPTALVQLPAAALAASLASAPSQNVCARCSLTFRMTSDLVYHMRSQHRRDGGSNSNSGNQDSVRQKRQEKLRCPVCGENFRERHHLTRHMTSHEDRDAK